MDSDVQKKNEKLHHKGTYGRILGTIYNHLGKKKYIEFLSSSSVSQVLLLLLLFLFVCLLVLPKPQSSVENHCGCKIFKSLTFEIQNYQFEFNSKI